MLTLYTSGITTACVKQGLKRFPASSYQLYAVARCDELRFGDEGARRRRQIRRRRAQRRR